MGKFRNEHQLRRDEREMSSNWGEMSAPERQLRRDERARARNE